MAFTVNMIVLTSDAPCSFAKVDAELANKPA
jgi:hypothetical protein